MPPTVVQLVGVFSFSCRINFTDINLSGGRLVEPEEFLCFDFINFTDINKLPACQDVVAVILSDLMSYCQGQSVSIVMTNCHIFLSFCHTKNFGIWEKSRIFALQKR